MALTYSLLHRDGTVSMARSGPDSATSSFFICIGDQPELDFGGKRNPDGQGFAAFGRVVSGILVSRTETEVVLRDVEGKDVKLSAADVETFTPQQKSLMPELLVKDLTAQQFADLLAYLSTLK